MLLVAWQHNRTERPNFRLLNVARHANFCKNGGIHPTDKRQSTDAPRSGPPYTSTNQQRQFARCILRGFLSHSIASSNNKYHGTSCSLNRPSVSKCSGVDAFPTSICCRSWFATCSNLLALIVYLPSDASPMRPLIQAMKFGRPTKTNSACSCHPRPRVADGCLLCFRNWSALLFDKRCSPGPATHFLIYNIVFRSQHVPILTAF